MKKTMLLMAALFLGFILHANATPVYLNPQLAEDISSGMPNKFANWKSAPDIKICTHAPVTRRQVDYALAWWEQRGYRFGSIITSSCIEKHNYGFIVIDLIGQGFDIGKNLATTKIHHDKKTGEIRWVKIYLTEPVRERILEHEIGHALGWLHSAYRGHILFPTWQGGGWDDKGVENPSLNLTR
jgi:hypothetical protein